MAADEVTPEVTPAMVMAECRRCFALRRERGPFRLQSGILRRGTEVFQPEGGQWLAFPDVSGRPEIVQADAAGRIPLPDRMAEECWVLSPPEDFLRLCGRIAAWEKLNGSGMVSERFGSYSFRRAAPGGMPLRWQQAFGTALAPYRRMFQEVPEG